MKSLIFVSLVIAVIAIGLLLMVQGGDFLMTGGTLFFVGLFVLYLAPTVIAAIRRKVNLAPIAVVNVLLGWTLVGWVTALVWALANPEPQAAPPTSTSFPPRLDLKSCPFCAEPIQRAAIKCKHCGSDLAILGSTRPENSRPLNEPSNWPSLTPEEGEGSDKESRAREMPKWLTDPVRDPGDQAG